MADVTDIMIYNFSERLLEDVVHFHIMKMTDSLFIWIGKEAELSSLSVAMCTKYGSTPAATNLLGDVSDLTSSTMAQKLARKFKKQYFISYNLPTENNLVTLVEKRLIKEIENKPKQF